MHGGVNIVLKHRIVDVHVRHPKKTNTDLHLYHS